MGELDDRKYALKSEGFWRELAVYIIFGVVPPIALLAGITISGWWEGWGLFLVIAFLVAYATVRFGMFLRLSAVQWIIAAVLFVAAYVLSFCYLLYHAHAYYTDPPPPPPRRKAEDDPRYHPRGTSVTLDWSEPHGTGGGS